MIGRTIDQYRIVAEIGRGGMGVVYRAEDTRLHCSRALKFLPVTVTPDSPDHTRLVNEARALASLEHPNICPVQEIGEHDGQTFIVMSYLEGRTLKDRLEEGPIPLTEALEITRQVSAGLAAAHAKGIVHRDVKPDNVMLTEGDGGTQGRPRAVLMDFGIAKNRETTLLTQTGTVMGTVAYMSPEQAKGEPVDAASDVWAVGVMLYEMLAGRRPFEGSFDPALLYAIVNTDPAPLTDTAEEIPASVEGIVGKALAKDKTERYADAGELLADLERAVAGEAVKGRRLVKRRRGPLVGAAVGVVALVLIALFVWPGFLAENEAISALAVMPLEVRGGEADQAYISEGIADELEAKLSKISALTVVSSNSAARARERYGTNREIGAELGVNALVEGSIQRVEDRIKVSVRLVDTEDDRLLWSESYTRDGRDILNLQSEIALAISTALAAELTPGEQEVLARKHTVDPRAHEAYLIGRSLIDRWSREDVEKGMGYLEQAIGIDPDFAPAYAGLATAYGYAGAFGGGWLPPGETSTKAREAATRALELDPSLPGAHSALGFVSILFDWDLERGRQEFERALEIDPNFAEARLYLAILLRRLGGQHILEAREQLERAIQADPLNPFYQVHMVWQCFFEGQLDMVDQEYDRLVDLNPVPVLLAQGITAKAYVAWSRNRVEEVETGLEQCVEMTDRKHPDYLTNLAKFYSTTGRRDEAMGILKELEALEQTRYVSPVDFAEIDASLGLVDEAFAELEKAYELRCGYLFMLTESLPGLRSDPRWNDLVERVGLPPSAPYIPGPAAG